LTLARAFVCGLRVVPGTELVGPAQDERPDQSFRVVPTGLEVRGEQVQHVAVGGLAGRAQVVEVTDERRAEQLVPGLVDGVARDVGVVGRAQPLGQCGPALARDWAGHPRQLRSERLRRRWGWVHVGLWGRRWRGRVRDLELAALRLQDARPGAV